jgi:8-oxo-dGTP pyrophosphatase MutT (NUDIX family)
MQRPSAARERALAVAAVRELGEETGLCLGCNLGERPAAGGVWRSYADTGLAPDLARLFFVARVVTPPRRSRRFDTRFFAVDANTIAHRVEGLVTEESELVELVWMPLARARELDMPIVTKVVLAELQDLVAVGLSHAQPVPYYRMLHRRFVRDLL